MVTPGESNNFYHYHDNRVMPSHVDAKIAEEGGAHLLCGNAACRHDRRWFRP